MPCALSLSTALRVNCKAPARFALACGIARIPARNTYLPQRGKGAENIGVASDGRSGSGLRPAGANNRVCACLWRPKLARFSYRNGHRFEAEPAGEGGIVDAAAAHNRLAGAEGSGQASQEVPERGQRGWFGE